MHCQKLQSISPNPFLGNRLVNFILCNKCIIEKNSCRSSRVQTQIPVQHLLVRLASVPAYFIALHCIACSLGAYSKQRQRVSVYLPVQPSKRSAADDICTSFPLCLDPLPLPLHRKTLRFNPTLHSSYPNPALSFRDPLFGASCALALQSLESIGIASPFVKYRSD